MRKKQDSHNEQYKIYILKKDKLRKYREIMRSVFIFSSETKEIMAERLYITETDRTDEDRKRESTVLSGKILTLIRNLFNVDTKQKVTGGSYICCPITNRIPLERFMLMFAYYPKKLESADKDSCVAVITVPDNDLANVVINLIRFGINIKVLKPDCVITRIKDKLLRQKQLFDDEL